VEGWHPGGYRTTLFLYATFLFFQPQELLIFSVIFFQKSGREKFLSQAKIFSKPNSEKSRRQNFHLARRN